MNSSGTALSALPIRKRNTLVKQRRINIIEGAHGPQYLAAKTTFEAVDLPEAVMTLLELGFECFLVLIRYAPQVIFRAAGLFAELNGLP